MTWFTAITRALFIFMALADGRDIVALDAKLTADEQEARRGG